MTIKEAFEALSNACAKGMKNPFFVMRRLKDSFADVADKVVDAGGSVVEVEAELTEGTEIATITIDGDDTKIYAPASSGGSSWTLAGSGTGTGSSARIELPEANEYLFIGYYSSTYYSVIAHPSDLTNGASFRTGFYMNASYNAGVAFTYDTGTKKIRLGTFTQNGSDVINSATIYAYYR